jgi:hypothetical protein
MEDESEQQEQVKQLQMQCNSQQPTTNNQQPTTNNHAGFLRVLRFPLPILIPPTAPYHHRSSGAGTIGQQWPTYQVDSVSQHPEKLKKKKKTK